MNILILSSGTRNKIVQYFKKTLAGKGKVITTDMSELAPAIYEADRYYIVPRMTEPGYLDVILDICKKEKIDGVLSLIDPEGVHNHYEKSMFYYYNIFDNIKLYIRVC